MTQTQRDGKSSWLGGVPEEGEIAGPRSEFDGEMLWIGRHAADQDILVFDPAESDPPADRVSFYSLTQHRTRTFPHSIVVEQIHGVTDDTLWRRARDDYDDRAARLQEYADAAAAEHAEVLERQRLHVLKVHRHYLEGMGLEHGGVEPTPSDHRPGRRSKCHICGIALDDFASTICLVCNGVLCSCGACACGASGSARSSRSSA